MTIQHKPLIVTGLIVLAVAGSTIAAHAVSISTTGKVHGPQTLTPAFQPADNIVITANPQSGAMTAAQLQPTVSPIK